MALTLSNLGRVAHERGDEAEAVAQFEEAERLIETLTDRLGAGLIKLGVAEAARDTNDYERAQALAQSALELLEQEGDQRGVALALAHLGSIATARRDFKRAYDHLARSLRLNYEMSDPYGVAFVMDRFAVLASLTGQPERALRLTGAAETLREQVGARPNALEQKYIDQQIETAQLALGRMADTALTAGRGLGVADAIAEALATVSQEVPAGLAIGADALSTRERQVVALLGLGYTNRRIAARLIVSDATVATHVRHVLAKLQLTTRAQVAVWAARHGLLDEPRLNTGVEHALLPG
jgi:non-specific serine/threonine protein kinase